MSHTTDGFPFDDDFEDVDGALMAAGLRGARALSGLSQSELAGLFGTTRQVLAKAERGVDVAWFFEAAPGILEPYGIELDVRTESVGVWRNAWTDRSSGTEMSMDRRAGILFESARSAANLTQRQLAAASGVSLRTIVSMEQGKSGLEAVRDAVTNALHRRRVDIVNGKDRSGINVLSDRVIPSPINVTFSEEGNSDFERIRKQLDASADVEHPTFVHYRIEIDETVPRIWREILIPENATFEDLHRTIQAVFGWRDRHLHQFELGINVGPVSLNADGPISEGHAMDERLVWLYDMSHRVTAFRYVYDFGDKWNHTIVRGASVRAEGRPYRPIVLDGAQAGPIEDSRSAQGYNELARKLRRKALDKEEGNWLQRRGYGRNYDPDAFDVEACNAALAELDFDIPSTWMEQYRRRSSVVVSAPFLKARTQEEEVEPRIVRSVRILKLEKFGEERFDEEGTGNPDEGSGFFYSRTMDRSVTMRSPASSILPDLLECDPEVASYAGFPVRVSYEADGKKGVFIPDAEVRFRDGRSLLVHTLWPDDIPLIHVYAFIAGRLKESGNDIVFIPSGCMDDPQFRTADEMRRFGNRAGPNELVDELLRKLVSRGTVKARDAIGRLIDAGHGVEGRFVGGSPERRALGHILDAASRRIVSMDMSAMDPFDSVIGPHGHFDASASFLSFATRWSHFDDQPPRRKGRRKP